MSNKATHSPKLVGLLLLLVGQGLNGCAIPVGDGAPENTAITGVESNTPVKQWPVSDPYVVRRNGQIQVIPDERYEPRPRKK